MWIEIAMLIWVCIVVKFKGYTCHRTLQQVSVELVTSENIMWAISLLTGTRVKDWQITKRKNDEKVIE